MVRWANLGKGEARRRYREFVAGEAEAAEAELQRMLRKVVMGGEAFRHRVSALMRKKRDMQEVPRAQRYEGRPELPGLFKGATTKKARDRRILDAYRTHGYTGSS